MIERLFQEAIPSAFLFDLDGTLIDTDDQIQTNLARRLRPLASLLPGHDPTRLARWLIMKSEMPSNALITLLDVLHLDDELFALKDRLHRWRAQRTPANFIPVPGTVELVRSLGQRFPLAIVSTRSRRDSLAFLEQYGLTDCFRVVVSHNDTVRLKPHPEPVLRASAALDVPPRECVMVGDTTVDVLAGRRAGAWTVAVLCGFGERPELERAGADLILEHTALLADSV